MSKPNILLILNDDMGYSDIGCYGGEVDTPNLDRLAANGLRFTQFYNTARCCPTRASLLTGLNPHQAGVGHMVTRDDGDDGYRGTLSRNTITIAELLGSSGYKTYMSGKWHVCVNLDPQGDISSWPNQRGFEEYYGIISGAANFWNPPTLNRQNERISALDEGDDYFFTDAISDHAADLIRKHKAGNTDQPFFSYVAYTAPHWPLHAKESDIEKYKGRFDKGWDKLREERLRRMVDLGIIDPSWKLTERDPTQPAWEDTQDKEWQLRRMEVYAAQIDCMDQGIGRILQALEETDQLDNTLIIFLADNGGCAEELFDTSYPYEKDPTPIKADRPGATALTRDGKPVMEGNSPKIMPGGEDTYQSYGVAWANLSNTPFREYKHWVHEGGISTPFIVHWPAGFEAKGELRSQPGQLMDVMATCADVAQAEWPEQRDGYSIPACEGFSLRPIFHDLENERPHLIWEHEGNCALRESKWKLVKKHSIGDWELYDMDADRTETNNLADANPDRVSTMAKQWRQWANRVGVLPWDEILKRRE